MTTQTADVTSPIVTENPPAPIVSPTVESVDGSATSGATPLPATTETPAQADPALVTTPDPVVEAKPVVDKIQERINEITAKRYAAERLADEEREKRIASENRVAELIAQAAKPADPNAKPALTEEEIDRRATEKATLMARANEFNKACNTIVEDGKKQFPDWDKAVENLNLVGAIGKNVPPTFLETAIELKNPHQVLHYLGTNLDEAERIVKSAPTKMAMELARIEAHLNAPKAAPAPAPLAPISAAPPPVIPVGGAAKPGAPTLDDPNISSAEWYKLREQQAFDHKNRYRRVSA